MGKWHEDMSPYHPSNGTAGMDFEYNYCEHCVHDAAWRDYVELEYDNPTLARYVRDNKAVPEPCPIWNAALLYEINEDGYPRDTLVWFNDRPTCLAFRDKDDDDDGKNSPIEPDPDQLDLFVELPVLVPA